MVTKFKYFVKNGMVTRKPEYSFTSLDELADRLEGVDSEKVVNSIINTTLKGEAELELIGIEDTWFKAQTQLQAMDKERAELEAKLTKGDRYGNPLTSEEQEAINARIAECKEGTIVIEKEFYDHYTRETHRVKEVIQTPYTIVLELRSDLESENPYLASFRGISDAPTRPNPLLDPNKEKAIKKLLVRQEIGIKVGDDKDLIADMSNALVAIIKKSNGQTLSDLESKNIEKFISRQETISNILNNY